MSETRFGSDRAVSELLGYILIFGMVTLAATSVLVLGTAQLETMRDSEQMTNAEKAFEVFSGNIDDQLSNDLRTRSTEVRVADANLYLGTQESIQIDVSPESEVLSFEYPVGEDVNPLIYESSQGSRVVYSNGAVFREEGDESRMIQEPRVLMDEDRSVIALAVTRGEDRITSPDTRVVQVRTELDNAGRYSPQFVYETDDLYTIDFTIQTTEPRAQQWSDYLETMYGEGQCTTTNEVVECTGFETDEVYIKYVPANVELN